MRKNGELDAVTHIKITAQHTGDERWIEAGSNAWAIHCWALTYCDQQMTDGVISRGMAERVALPVAPESAPAAVDKLLELGLWKKKHKDELLIADYETYALLAEEKRATQAKWAKDARIRRKHKNGVHDECHPDKCPVAKRMSPAESTPDSRRSPARVQAPIPDTTRPDPTVREGRVTGRRGTTSAADAPDDDAAAAGGKAPHEFAPRLAARYECSVCGLARRAIVHQAHLFEPTPDEPGKCLHCTNPEWAAQHQYAVDEAHRASS